MKKALVVIFCLMAHIPLFADRPKILVLHSYHEGMDWTDNLNRGIQQYMNGRYVEVLYEYMDTKRNISRDYLNRLIDLYKAKFKAVNFSAVIICDNNALAFFKENRIDYFRGIPAVFCGINDYSPSMIKGIPRITGVAEHADFDNTIALMLKLHKKTQKIYIINDNKTTTAKTNRKILERVMGKYKDRVEFEFIEDLSYENLSRKVIMLKKSSLILLVTYSKDADGRFISYRQIIENISGISPVPVYGTWNFYMGYGLTGGVITSGADQGRAAAEMAWKIIEGTPVSSIPIVKGIPGRYMFDHRMLEHFGIDPDSLPENSEIINLPASGWQEYKWFIISALFFMCAAVIALVVRIIFDAHNRRVLENQNLILEDRVTERTEGLEKANRDRDRLLSIIGHDLRSPMANILSLCRVLNSSFAAMDEEKRFELIAILNSRVEPTMDLLDNLLYWAQDQASGLVPEPEMIDLSEIIEKVRSLVLPRLREKELQFYSMVPAKTVCYADRHMIETVLRNLISNSIKFTEGQGVLTVSAVAEEGRVKISVSDTGTGFPEQILQDFEKMELAPSSYGTRQEKGTGLGLSLCREMLRYNDSVMVFSNNPEGGSVVSFTLPSERPAA